MLALTLLAGCSNEPKAPGKYAKVAQCLSEKGVVMYGAFWCPHCANQKKTFGDDFQFVTYQECDDRGAGGNSTLCKSKGVTSYPTWFFPGQGNLVGEQTIEELAKYANCSDALTETPATESADTTPAAASESDAVAPAEGSGQPAQNDQGETNSASETPDAV